eukprot:3071897-Amphidinium_carterae.2
MGKVKQSQNHTSNRHGRLEKNRSNATLEWNHSECINICNCQQAPSEERKVCGGERDTSQQTIGSHTLANPAENCTQGLALTSNSDRRKGRIRWNATKTAGPKQEHVFSRSLDELQLQVPQESRNRSLN